MEPTLGIDDIILVKIGDNYGVNDIISYIQDDAIVTHRIISVSGNNIIVKGDANNSTDTPITSNDVIGKVVKIYPKLKRWKDILSDPKILIGLVITIILFDFAISYKKPDDKKTATAEGPQVDEEQLIVHVNEDESKKIDSVKKENLIELTRAIDLNEIDVLLSEKPKERKIKAEIPKLHKDEEKKEVEVVQEEVKVEEPIKLVEPLKRRGRPVKKVEEEDNKEDDIRIEKVTATRRGVKRVVPKKTPKKVKEFKLYEDEEVKKESTIRLNLKAIQKTIEKKVK